MSIWGSKRQDYCTPERRQGTHDIESFWIYFAQNYYTTFDLKYLVKLDISVSLSPT